MSTSSTTPPVLARDAATETWTVSSTEQLIPTVLGRLNVRVGGKTDDPVMVCWPSLLMNHSMWRFQYEHYAATHRVVLIDAPGIGKSEALRKVISLEECAECLVALLDALDVRKCLFVGNSWGALLGSVFAAWHPERLTGAVLANGTAAPPTLAEKFQMTLLTTALGLNRTAPRWLASAARSSFAGKTAEAAKPEFMDYLSCVLGEDPKSMAYAMKGILLGRKDRYALLRTIKDVPVLVIAGAEDRQFPVATVQRLADAIPGSRFAVLPGTAHLAPRESLELVNAEIDAFIAELPA